MFWLKMQYILIQQIEYFPPPSIVTQALWEETILTDGKHKRWESIFQVYHVF